MTYEEREKAIKAEKIRLGKIFKDTDVLTGVGKGLIDNAAFMAVAMAELRDTINEKGFVEEYKNGENQSGVKKTSEVDIYNNMIKNYVSVVKQLTAMSPDSKTEANALIDFVRGSK